MEILIKSSAILFIFYACYRFFLAGETFFRSNRQFLNLGLLCALALPWIVIPVHVVKTAPEITGYFYENSSNSLAEVGAAVTSWTILDVLFSVYLIGLLLFVAKFIMDMLSLGLLILRSRKIRENGFTFVRIKAEVSPFSFFRYIVYNPEQFDADELNSIVEHEKVHARQWHSIDVLAARFICILNWFNPVAWLYLKSIEQNLEFMADSCAQQKAECESSYQRLLLKATVPEYKMVLANNFYNSLIKKRIVMLHKTRSNRSNQLKMALIAPILALFLMSFNTKEIVTYETLDEPITLNPIQAEDFTDQENVEVIITKDMSDDELDKLRGKFKDLDITLKFKGVKRNSKNEITAIQISVKSDKSSSNYSANSDEGISSISIKVEDGSISIGDGSAHKGHEVYSYRTGEDGNVWIKKGSKADDVYIYSDDDEHLEIHESDGKVIIKSGDQIKEIKKINKGGSAVFIKDGDADGDIEIIEIQKAGQDGHDVIIKKSKDGKMIKEWIEKDDDNVFISRADDNVRVVVREVKDDNIQIMGGEDALYIIDGKEVTKAAVDKLSSDDIATIEVIKGDKAIAKYGDKARNGVIVVIMKE